MEYWTISKIVYMPQGLLLTYHLVATLQHCDKDDILLLSDLEIPPSDTRTISVITDKYHTHLMSSQVSGRDVVSLEKIRLVPHGRRLHEKIFLSASSNLPYRDQHQDIRAHLEIHFIFCTPPDPAGSKELVQNCTRRGVEFLVRSSDLYFLVQLPLKELLYQH